jgi:hypothetical protein
VYALISSHDIVETLVREKLQEHSVAYSFDWINLLDQRAGAILEANVEHPGMLDPVSQLLIVFGEA